MQKVLDVLSWMAAHYQELCAALVGLLSAFIGVFALIPGDQPEKFLQSVVDFISKFSRKPAVEEKKSE